MKYKLIILFIFLVISASPGLAHTWAEHPLGFEHTGRTILHSSSLDLYIDTAGSDGVYGKESPFLDFVWTGVDANYSYLQSTLLDDNGVPVDTLDDFILGTNKFTYQYPVDFEAIWPFSGSGDNYADVTRHRVYRHADAGMYETCLFTSDYSAGVPLVCINYLVNEGGTSPLAGQSKNDTDRLCPGCFDEDGNPITIDPGDEYSETKVRWNALFWADSFQACMLILFGMIIGARMAGKVGAILALICGTILFTAIGWLPLYGVMLIFICIFIVLGIKQVT